MTEPIKLLMLDWDGTLVDSIGRIVESMQVAARHVDVTPQSDAAIRGIIGLGLPEAIRELHPELLGDSRYAPFKDAYSDHYMALEASPSAFFSGAFEMLEQLREQGVLLTVATGKSRRGLDRVLSNKGLTDYFVATRCADETASKPDPLMLHELMTYCGVKPEQAAMVGDSVFDLRMGKNAGVRTFAAVYGAMPAPVLLAEQPDGLLQQFTEIGNFFTHHSTETEKASEHAL